MNDKLSAAFLAWDIGEPNNDTNQNYVRIALTSGLYRDNPASGYGEVCNSCLLDRSLLLRLDGLCEDSFMGILFIIQFLLIFLDLKYFATNAGATIGFNGWRNTFIRQNLKNSINNSGMINTKTNGS